MATNSDGIGQSSEERAFWLASQIHTQDHQNAVTTDVQDELHIGHVLREVDLVWGSYKPDNSLNSFSPSTPGSNSGTKSSGSYPPYPSPGTLNDSSAGNSTNSICEQPPAPEINGFPTAPCGSPTFDKDLDDKIGYLDFDSTGFSAVLEDFARGLDDYSSSDNQGFGTSRRRMLYSRGPLSFISRVANVRATHSSIESLLSMRRVSKGAFKWLVPPSSR